MRIGPEMEVEPAEFSLEQWLDYRGSFSGLDNTKAYEASGIEGFVNKYLQDTFQKTLSPEIIQFFAEAVIAIIDYHPYSLILDGPDVVATYEGMQYSYAIKNTDGTLFEISNVGELETFRHVPGMDQQHFEKMMYISDKDRADKDFNPAQRVYNYSDMFGQWLEDTMDYGEMYYEMNPIEQLERDNELAYYELIAFAGKENTQKIVNIIIWLSFAWIISPMARQWRALMHEVIDTCYNTGEAIVHEGNCYSSEEFVKELRPPTSCCVCGLDSYCVDLTYVDGGVKHICEKHLNGNIPGTVLFQCGTKICKYSECPNHPQYKTGANIIDYYKTHGQLNKNVDKTELLSFQETKKISNA